MLKVLYYSYRKALSPYSCQSHGFTVMLRLLAASSNRGSRSFTHTIPKGTKSTHVRGGAKPPRWQTSLDPRTLAQRGSCRLHVRPTWAQRALLSGHRITCSRSHLTGQEMLRITLNLSNACQVYSVECVSKIKLTRSLNYLYAIYGVTCFPLTHFLLVIQGIFVLHLIIRAAIK